MKYIINVEPIKGTNLYKATKFNALVFDDEGLRRLEKVEEKPLVRNVDHVAEGLEKLGYKVSKDYIVANTCPIPYAAYFDSVKTTSCPEEAYSCEECRKWWLEEWKGENIPVSNGRF